jgi:acyl-coenzyme A synthetase/AMP-(fatty) acid ligase
VNVLADPLRVGIREACAAYGVTWLGLAAIHARALVGDGGGALPSGINIRMGGSAVPQRLRRDILTVLGPRLFVGYGTSEIGSIATAGPEDHVGEADTLGTVHNGVELEIVDGEDRQVPSGAAGFVRVRSAGMPHAYHDDEAATVKAFRGGWFYPGDMARREADGRLCFEGRADDMMILASINIFPAEIERAVEDLPGVVESAAFAMKSAEFGDIPMLAVVGRDIAADAVLAHARRVLGLRAPRKVFMVDALPRGREGKVRRRELQKLLDPKARSTAAGT